MNGLIHPPISPTPFYLKRIGGCALKYCRRQGDPGELFVALFFFFGSPLFNFNIDVFVKFEAVEQFCKRQRRGRIRRFQRRATMEGDFSHDLTFEFTFERLPDKWRSEINMIFFSSIPKILRMASLFLSLRIS